MRSLPTRRQWIGGAALSSLALLLVVLGAAARPLFISETAAPATVLNETETGFVQDMLAHHQQALIMVQRLNPDTDPTVRRLAQQIGDSQRVEVGTLMGWLRLAHATNTNPQPMSWMHNGGESAMTGHEHHPATTTSGTTTQSTTMPGMATKAELDALSAATGRDAETLFLQLMQRHHYGGVAMAQAADALLTSGPVKSTARDMATTQGQEIGYIGMLLAQRG
ncbi:DUF305 domain-containing protein [Nocardia sp. SYP-A9097]|uniref:DUF305 domain-containing protein n=1 Tax=Nocardia sp. SYP-A9097 TaxID=2663237 RepID=UPI00129B39ED|nr:DUF305 domain-containing protein [Nocardia sp. SYP-A9097]MRH90745.1 DUF305 domain-containing protein [Nocardia sp. SYP-A9097]